MINPCRTPGRTVTLILVNFASILEKADEVLLPAVYQEMGEVLDASPFTLGILTFYRALVQSAFSPLAAYLALRHNRALIIGFGALWWGAATFVVGASSTYWVVAVARAANGIGLAVVVPAIQSLVADYHVEQHRGLGFGFLHASSQIGAILGGFFATLMASKTAFGLAGWRVAFHVVALISVLCGLAIYQFGVDPRPPKPPKWKVRKDVKNDYFAEFRSDMWEMWMDACQVSSIRTFQVIVAQGLVGQVPWNAMVFFTLWLELTGYSHTLAAVLVAMLSIGNMIGSVFGGWVGDWASRRSPNVGRILCAQFSAGAAIPLAAILLIVVPTSPDWGLAVGALFLLMGFVISWNSPACNWPIFSEIVPARLRTAVFAFDMALEKSFAAVGAPMVGLIAQKVYGFQDHSEASPAPTGDFESLQNTENANSLAKGLFLMIGVPFFLCVSLIFGLYWTYPGDRDRARVEAWVDESSRALELEDGDSDRKGSSFRIEGEDWISEGELDQYKRQTRPESPPVSLVEIEFREHAKLVDAHFSREDFFCHKDGMKRSDVDMDANVGENSKLLS